MYRIVAAVFALLAPFATRAADGTPMAQVLRTLSSPQLQFVFSSRLVPDTLRVPYAAAATTPSADEALRIASELLRTRGLALTRIGPGLYAVVEPRGAAANAAPATVARNSPATAAALSEIVVSASRYRVADPVSASTRLDAANLALEIVPGSDPLRALARLPGVVQEGLSARSHVRGGDQGEELLLLDGFPLRNPFHLAGYQSPFSVIDATLIRSIDVFTGGFPARYGDRMSGVFDLHSFAADELPARSLAADFINASARVAGILPGSGIETIADARIGTLDPLLRTLAPRAGSPRYGDAFVSAARSFTGGARLSAHLLWSRDELTIEDRSRQESARMDGRLRYLWLQGQLPLWGGGVGEAWLGQTVIDSRRDGSVATPGVVSGSVADRRDSTLWDLRTRATFGLGANHFLEVGGDFTQEEGSYRYSAAARYPADVAALFARAPAFDYDLAADPQRRRSSLFASHRWRVLPTVTTELGLRASAVVSRGLETRWDLDPRTGVRWDLSPDTRLRLNWGRFRQADEIHELKIEDGLTRFPAPQFSEHLILGFEHSPLVDTLLRAELFSKRQTQPRARFENLFNRRSLLPELGADRVQILPTDAEVHGIELSAQQQRGAWRLTADAGWSEALDETDGAHTRRSWDVGWNAALAASWRRGAWTVSSSIERRPGFPTTLLVSDASGTHVGAVNDTRLPGVFALDLRGDYVRALDRGVLQLSAQVTNALNQREDCCSELLRDGSGLYLRRLRGLPLLPSLGARWSW